ncbi:10030_t:CDS:2 [Acaulospora colombiana]|uniref:10030_t:CDS:1 n=1 Tax=Acaulospora colombiana TaxID=27376 RepID=A0ACA9L169_9GLOM|nr:10030_t:CDS:2 [Acaulospora colombiana]
MKKLDLLQNIATETSAKEIIDEISGYIIGDDVGVTAKSIQTVAKIAMRIKNTLTYSLDIFMKLMETGIDDIVSGIVTVIEGPNEFGELISSALPSVWSSINLKSSAGPAFLNLLTTVGSSLPESPYILESLIDDIKNYPNTPFRVQLLNSTVSLFLKRPAECQGMLAKLFKSTMGSTERLEVRERAEFLFRMLKYDIGAVSIFCFIREPSDIHAENFWLIVGLKKVKKIFSYEPPETLKTLDKNNSYQQIRPLHEFNTLSIIHGKPQEQVIAESAEFSIQREKMTSYHDTLDFDEVLMDFSGESLIKVAKVDNYELSMKVIDAKLSTRVEKEVSIAELSTLLMASDIMLKNVECTLEENSIMVMASGDTNGALKLFLYAQEANSQELSLCGLKINVQSAQVNICIKSGYLSQNTSTVDVGDSHEVAKMDGVSPFSNFLSERLIYCLKNLGNFDLI